MVLSLPENWNYSINGLAAVCKEGVTAIKSALEELKDNGYLIVKKLNPSETDSGRFEYEYNFYESPKQDKALQDKEKQDTENLYVENLPLYKVLKNKDTNNKEKINKKEKFKKPTIEEIQAYIEEKGYNVDAEQFYEYYEDTEWKVGSRSMKNWKRAVLTWQKNEEKWNPTKKIKGTDNRGAFKVAAKLLEQL